MLNVYREFHNWRVRLYQELVNVSDKDVDYLDTLIGDLRQTIERLEREKVNTKRVTRKGGDTVEVITKQG